VSGFFCGRVFDPSRAPVPGTELRVEDRAGAVVATTHADANGDFVFGALPKGTYRLTTTAPGFMSFVAQFVVATEHQAKCKRRYSVYLALSSCVGGGISKDKP
jgi:hypothetical protein